MSLVHAARWLPCREGLTARPPNCAQFHLNITFCGTSIEPPGIRFSLLTRLALVQDTNLGFESGQTTICLEFLSMNPCTGSKPQFHGGNNHAISRRRTVEYWNGVNETDRG